MGLVRNGGGGGGEERGGVGSFLYNWWQLIWTV